jgi:DNA-binding Xre family transcriptional regulator
MSAGRVDYRNLLFQQKSCESIKFFLPPTAFTVIIDNNAACGAVIVPAVGYLHKKPCRVQGFCSTGRRMIMAVSYKKLWKLLIDKDIKKKDLSAKAGVSPATITKMGKNGHVTTEVLLKICTALDCKIEDIMEVIHDIQEV